MDNLVFENPQRLTRKDIYLRIIFGLGLLFLVGFCAPLRNPGQPFSWTSTRFLVFGMLLLTFFIFNAVRETTLKSEVIKPEKEIITFVMDRQIGDELIFDFKLKKLHWT